MPQKEFVGEITWPPANAQEIAKFSSTEALDKARAEEAEKFAKEVAEQRDQHEREMVGLGEGKDA